MVAQEVPEWKQQVDVVCKSWCCSAGGVDRWKRLWVRLAWWLVDAPIVTCAPQPWALLLCSQALGKAPTFGIRDNRSIKDQRESLPIFKLREQLIQAVHDNQVGYLKLSADCLGPCTVGLRADDPGRARQPGGWLLGAGCSLVDSCGLESNRKACACHGATFLEAPRLCVPQLPVVIRGTAPRSAAGSPLCCLPPLHRCWW